MKLAHDSWFTFDKLQHVGKGILTYCLVDIAFPAIVKFIILSVAAALAGWTWSI